MKMKNSDASKHHSISKRLSLGLVVTLLVVAIISLVVNYIISSRTARTELELKSNEYIVALAIVKLNIEHTPHLKLIWVRLFYDDLC